MKPKKTVRKIIRPVEIDMKEFTKSLSYLMMNHKIPMIALAVVSPDLNILPAIIGSPKLKDPAGTPDHVKQQFANDIKNTMNICIQSWKEQWG